MILLKLFVLLSLSSAGVFGGPPTGISDGEATSSSEAVMPDPQRDKVEMERRELLTQIDEQARELAAHPNFSTPRLTGTRFPSLSVAPKYSEEEKGARIETDSGLKWFHTIILRNRQEQELFRVYFVNDQVCDAKGVPLALDRFARYMAVMDVSGNFYAARKKTYIFHHSSFGVPFAAAMTWHMNGGKIVGMDNQSGHLLPPFETLRPPLEMLKRQGVDISKITVMGTAKLLPNPNPGPERPKMIQTPNLKGDEFLGVAGCVVEHIMEDTEAKTGR